MAAPERRAAILIALFEPVILVYVVEKNRKEKGAVAAAPIV
jgi:hypothetical protein